MRRYMLGHPDIVIGYEYYQDMLAAAEHRRLRAAVPTTRRAHARVHAGRALVRTGRWLMATVESVTNLLGRAKIGGNG